MKTKAIRVCTILMLPFAIVFKRSWSRIHFFIIISHLLTLGSFIAIKATPVKEEYEVWKGHERAIWKRQDEKSLPYQLFDLAHQVNESLARNVPNTLSNAEFLLFPYNFLRELLQLETKSSLQEADRAWLKTILPELELNALAEKGDIERAAPEAQKLMDRVVHSLNIQKKIYAALDPYGGHSGKTDTGLTYIALLKTPDPDRQLFVIYHELGHIYYNDSENERLIADKKITPEELYKKHCFKADCDAIKKYVRRGIELVFSLRNTYLGKLLSKSLVLPEVREALTKRGTLWIPPTNHAEYQKIAYFRCTEQRADIFAIKNLLKHKLLSTVLAGINAYGGTYDKQPQLIANSTETHPSHLERALYMLGYLKEQGINVPSVLYNWEKK